MIVKSTNGSRRTAAAFQIIRLLSSVRYIRKGVASARTSAKLKLVVAVL
jgi:hypothetical protein